MLYLRPTKRGNDFKSPPVIFTLFFLLIILGVGYINPSFIKQPLQNLAIKVSETRDGTTAQIAKAFSIFYAKVALQDENQKLKNELANLNLFCTSTIQNLTKTNQDLESALGRNTRGIKTKAHEAFVIAKPPLGPYDTITVDLGSKAGIKKDDLVTTGGYIVGKIFSTTESKSLVEIFGKKGQEINFLIGEKKIVTNAVGNGLGTYKAKVLKEILNVEDKTARISFAPNYIFGSIISEKQEETGLYEEVIIRSPINIFELSSVSIISNEKN
jgi:cell shape-determining protein MreC